MTKVGRPFHIFASEYVKYKIGHGESGRIVYEAREEDIWVTHAVSLLWKRDVGEEKILSESNLRREDEERTTQAQTQGGGEGT
ncbi:MAG: hypothetical protein ACR2GU_15185 [Rubrobacteraceae bacterium]